MAFILVIIASAATQLTKPAGKYMKEKLSSALSQGPSWQDEPYQLLPPYIAPGSGDRSSNYKENPCRSESSWSTLKSKSPKSIVSEEAYEERKHKKQTGDGGYDDKT
ncbi:hypothetical protein A6R68_19247, partial [Neotoma lepida]